MPDTQVPIEMQLENLRRQLLTCTVHAGIKCILGIRPRVLLVGWRRDGHGDDGRARRILSGVLNGSCWVAQGILWVGVSEVQS